MNLGFELRLLMLSLIFIISCQKTEQKTEKITPPKLRFEKINFFNYSFGTQESRPYKSRVTYYFKNGLPHRWIENDSSGAVLTDFIYQYDQQWVRTGAKYKEPEETKYSVERLSYSQDSMKITTEWLDSLGKVYYQMIEELDSAKKPFRSTFIGDKIHGYDTLYYTKEGFEKRVFFTNVKGNVYNDRTFVYTQINEQGDWAERNKVVDGKIAEVQKRMLSYSNDYFGNENKLFYEEVVSTKEWDENVMSFNREGDVLFFTRGKDWQIQQGFVVRKENGLFSIPKKLAVVDTLYNGAISPSGNKIIFCKRLENDENEIWLTSFVNYSWQTPIQLSIDQNIKGGYFNWYDENEIYMYSQENEGDLIVVNLSGNKLILTEKLKTLNTEKGTEFSPFVGKDKKYIMFTRYLEGDQSQQGVFISYNNGTKEKPVWSAGQKIEALPYGWSAFVSSDEKFLYFSDGEDIYCYPTEFLALTL